jgi:hypothetical protein
MIPFRVKPNAQIFAMLLVQKIHAVKADALWVATNPADRAFPPLLPLLLFQDG